MKKLKKSMKKFKRLLKIGIKIINNESLTYNDFEDIIRRLKNSLQVTIRDPNHKSFTKEMVSLMNELIWKTSKIFGIYPAMKTIPIKISKEEIPDYKSGKLPRGFNKNAKEIYKFIIRHEKNHPSEIDWEYLRFHKKINTDKIDFEKSLNYCIYAIEFKKKYSDKPFFAGAKENLVNDPISKRNDLIGCDLLY